MNRKILIVLHIVLITAALFPVDIETVRWGTEVWKGFTDTDGSGLYTRLMKRIFESEGIELDIRFYPLNRALYLTEIGEVDISGGLSKDSADRFRYAWARYPIAVSRFKAFYHKDLLNHSDDHVSLGSKAIVCTPGIGDMVGLAEGEYEVVTTRDQALKLVLMNRFEVYIDDEKVLRDTVDRYKDQFDMNDYETAVIAEKGYYMIGTKNERGQRILEIFDKGMKKLEASGELDAIYQSLGFITPRIDE